MGEQRHTHGRGKKCEKPSSPPPVQRKQGNNASMGVRERISSLCESETASLHLPLQKPIAFRPTSPQTSLFAFWYRKVGDSCQHASTSRNSYYTKRTHPPSWLRWPPPRPTPKCSVSNFQSAKPTAFATFCPLVRRTPTTTSISSSSLKQDMASEF